MSLGQIFIMMLSLAAVSFGGGTTLMAGLERELVQTGRLSPTDFARAIALGQSTPGPIAAFTSAIGSSLHGVSGALAATSALLFLSFCAVALISRVPRAWFSHPSLRAGLGAVAPVTAALALYLGYRTWHGAGSSLIGTILLVAVAAGRLVKLPTPALVLTAVVVGMLFH